MLIIKNKIYGQKGASVYIAFLIMVIILAMSVGLTTILVGQLKVVRNMGYSVVAFYAADAGIERALVEGALNIGESLSGDLDNTASYEVKKVAPSTQGDNFDCIQENPEEYCLISVGAFKGVTRAIQITR